MKWIGKHIFGFDAAFRQAATFAGTVGIGIAAPTSTYQLRVDGHTLISAEKYYYVAGNGGGIGSDASGNLILRQNSADLMTTSGSDATFAGTVTATNLSGTNTGDVCATNHTAAGYISHDGSTANGVLTYKDADEATVEANLTFNGSTLSVEADSNTTQNALFIDANALTTGSAIKLDIDDPDAVSHTAATTQKTLTLVDYDKAGDIASGETAQIISFRSQMTDNATSNVGITNLAGFQVLISSASTNGTNVQTGFYAELSGDPSSLTTGFSSDVANGGIDFKAVSSTNAADYFTIATGEDGATTLTTVESGGGSTAHFEIAADGNITLDPAGSIALEGATTITGAFTVGVDGTGHDVKFFGATSGKYMLWDESADALTFPDSTYLFLGTSSDLAIHHDGSNTYLENKVGDLKFKQEADDKDIIFQCDDGSGGTTAYLTLDGSAGYTTAQKHIRFEDDVNAQFGTGADMGIYHNGSNGFIKHDVGDLTIKNTADDRDIIFQCDDGSGGDTAYLTLDGSTGWTTVHTPLELVVTPEPENPEAGSGVIWMEESGSIYAKITVGEVTAIVVIAEFVGG
jgi:hypothetical protein